MAVPEWIKSHGIQHPLQAKFLAAYTHLGMVTRTAETVGINPCTHYEWLKTVPEYKAAWEEAEIIATGLLEDEAYRRAVLGVSKPVYYQGVECGQVQEYSDALMALKLRGHLPKKYRENIHQEISADENLSALLDKIVKAKSAP